MYLSRLEINPARREARRLLANPQALHATVLKAVAPEPDERVLWRADEGHDSVVLYITSQSRPNFAELASVAAFHPTEQGQTANYDPFLARLAQDEIFAFRLTANPTHLVTINGVKKRTAHVTVNHQRDWFLGKADQHGFEVLGGSLPDPQLPEKKSLELAVSDRSTRVFRRAGKPVTLAYATFTGRLKVTDAEAMRAALTGGIGPAKAYGCGLMTLAAAR